MKNNKTLRLIALASSLSFMLAGSLVGGYLVGQYFDQRAGSGGLLTALFILLGIGAGFYNVYRTVKKEEK